jgi:hypothetical protein
MREERAARAGLGAFAALQRLGGGGLPAERSFHTRS